MMATLAKCTSIQEPCAASYARQNPAWAPMPPWDPPPRHTLLDVEPPPSPWFAPWARSGQGRRVNCEWGSWTPRANKSTERLFSQANAKRRTAGGSHEYLIEKDWEKLEGGVREEQAERWGEGGWLQRRNSRWRVAGRELNRKNRNNQQ